MAHMHSFLPVRSVYSFSKYQSMLYFLLKTFIIIDSFELKLKELQWGLSSTLFLLLITVLFWTRYLFQRTHIIPFSVPISLIIYFILFLLFLCPHLPPLWQPSDYVLFLWVCFCFVLVSLDSTYELNHAVFIFHCLTYFT